LIHGDYISNKLKLKDKKLLKFDYEFEEEKLPLNLDSALKRESSCLFRNFTDFSLEKFSVEFYTKSISEEKTSVIPNLMNKAPLIFESEEENKFVIIFEDILYVLVPIVSIIFFIFLLIYCRQKKIKRMRMSSNLSQLKVTSHIDYQTSDPNDSSSLIINNLV
jgi:hypothetical protein